MFDVFWLLGVGALLFGFGYCVGGLRELQLIQDEQKRMKERYAKPAPSHVSFACGGSKDNQEAANE